MLKKNTDIFSFFQKYGTDTEQTLKIRTVRTKYGRLVTLLLTNREALKISNSLPSVTDHESYQLVGLGVISFCPFQWPL